MVFEVPDPPLLPGQTLVSNGDGTYLLLDDAGIPLGTMFFDEENGEWVFIPLPEIPLAPGGYEGGSWALMNLLATMLSLMATLAMFVLFATRKRLKKKEEGEAPAEGEVPAVPVTTTEAAPQAAPGAMTGKEPEQDLNLRKKQYKYAYASVAAVIIGAVLFVITQDTALQMAMVDIWTVAHVPLLGYSIFALTKMKSKKSKADPHIGDKLDDLEPAGQAA